MIDNIYSTIPPSLINNRTELLNKNITDFSTGYAHSIIVTNNNTSNNFGFIVNFCDDNSVVFNSSSVKVFGGVQTTFYLTSDGDVFYCGEVTNAKGVYLQDTKKLIKFNFFDLKFTQAFVSKFSTQINLVDSRFHIYFFGEQMSIYSKNILTPTYLNYSWLWFKWLLIFFF
jgi:alpha-tubulin suppressor-like RCC1 family protein